MTDDSHPTSVVGANGNRDTTLQRVIADQRRRWQAGERALVERLVSEHPQLQSDREATLDLVYNEILLREQRDEDPSLQEYVGRFPHLEADLALQFELEEGLRREIESVVRESSSGVVRDAKVLRPPSGMGDPHARFGQVPDFEILEVLGRGGMGVVYRARQVSLNRQVALKMILAGVHAGPQELARFRTEAEAAARLKHPNIVQVYEIGAQDGRPFMVLELVEESLAKKLAGTPLPPRQAAQWVETLARAIHYAHEHGIVHRDLKPANILLTRASDLKITDFGMAKIGAGRAGGETVSGAILGTPSYMAPEQAEGKTRDIGPRTDIYGLGAILYELLTGRPPFRAATMQETLDQVRLQEPTPPSRLQPNLPRDLETICLTCLRKEPECRYATAEALADDLNAFLVGEAIRSRPFGPWERLARSARRRPAEVVLASTSLLAVVGIGVGIVWSHALAVGAISLLGLPFAGWLYYARLQRALREARQQQLLAERSIERLHLLLEMTRRLMRPAELDELLRLLAETTAWLANAEMATIYLLDRERGELWSKVTLDQGIGEIRLPLGVGIAGAVAASGEPINLADAYADPRFNQDIDRRTGHKTRNLLTVPIAAPDGSIQGVFQVGNKQEGAFGVDDIEILSSLAASASIAIEQAAKRREL